MSLHPQPIAPVPEQTVRVAAAAFPKGNPYLTLRDQLGTIFQDEDFAMLFPAWGFQGDVAYTAASSIPVFYERSRHDE